MSGERPDVDAELARLKGFQRNAAKNAFQRLFTAEDRTGRFLIADEVGLGKTLIARGIVALAIDHMWESIPRIDVVYVCSNASIARQNVRRLGFGALKPVERLTLLPVTVQDLEASKLNFIAITPGTSLEARSSLGIRRERQLLYHLLERLWPVGGSGPMNLLQGHVTKRKAWRASLRQFLERETISEPLQASYHDLLRAADKAERAEGGAGLRARWESACARFKYGRQWWSDEDAALRRDIVGELRTHLARSCIDALEPDLVILDEFQRFKHLLVPEEGGEAGELARRLFEWADDTAEARVLMLSATPYKMYTLAHEREEDDHYADFLRTVGFLQRDEVRTEAFARLLGDYRRALFRLAEGNGESAAACCRAIEVELRRVMSRTERVGATGGRDGMLETVEAIAGSVDARDLIDFVALDGLARELGASNVMEVWKSAPYLLSFSEDYELDKRMERACWQGVDHRTAALLSAARGSFLEPEEVEAYAAFDPANARLRSLLGDVVDSGLWRCLWLPPSCPSYTPSGAYASAEGATKRLVFSAWKVVPRVISALVSYEVERCAFLAEDLGAENTLEARERRKPLLRFSRSSGRLTGMPLFTLIFPSAVLAELGDPRRHAARRGSRLDRSQLLAEVEVEVRGRLQPLVAAAPDAGPVDEAWYWAAPILLDMEEFETLWEFWEEPDLDYLWATVEGEEERRDEDGNAWAEHVEEALRLVRGELELGRAPDDLAELLARVGVAGPATAALRSLARVLPGASLEHPALRLAAAQIGWGFRALFNRPEATAIVRGREREVPLWRLVLEHCVDGCLGDVLDEHLHILRDFEGLFGAEIEDAAQSLAYSLREATGLRTTRTSYRTLVEDGGMPELGRRNLRGHYALRFGVDETEGGGQALRSDQVRAAFNSPFWPFVLASTSVGQEGLDFHAWCHAIVHWNLPSNPVDLEQREGRVHRFKGHAVRKNVARAHGSAVLIERGEGDPWATYFEKARRATPDDRGGLVPYWVFETEGGAHIERHVPAHPHSKDSLKFEALKKSLALYRMVFGQPRQDDLMAFLTERVPPAVLEPLMRELRVDLSPVHDGWLTS